MAQVIIRRTPATDVYCYDARTHEDEVNELLHALVREHGMKKNIWVVSGTHGNPSGS